MTGSQIVEFFEAVYRRRSCRIYTENKVPSEIIEKAIDAAIKAPNSSNVQTWQFVWVRSSEARSRLVEACLNQSTARTAQEFVVIAAQTSLWRQHVPLVIEQLKKENANPKALLYYQKLIPLAYGLRFLSPLKWILIQIVGLFRPVPRGHFWPWSDDEVAIKSAALAAENFMLAIAAQGYDTCPMEGMDECRVRKIANLPRSARIVMVISVGERTLRGIWGEQYRVPRELVVKEV